MTLYSFPLILNNLIVLSAEQEAKTPDFNWVTQYTLLLCSLIVKSG